jgi:hypothetical protein
MEDLQSVFQDIYLYACTVVPVVGLLLQGSEAITGDLRWTRQAKGHTTDLGEFDNLKFSHFAHVEILTSHCVCDSM